MHVAQYYGIPSLATYLYPVTPTRAFPSMVVSNNPEWLSSIGWINWWSFRLYNLSFFRMTLPVINNARHIFALVVGASKADIFGEIVEKNLQVPVAKVDPVDGQLEYLLDKEAAQKLPYRDSCSHEGQAVFYEFGK